jgi:hypothetical protein
MRGRVTPIGVCDFLRVAHGRTGFGASNSSGLYPCLANCIAMMVITQRRSRATKGSLPNSFGKSKKPRLDRNPKRLCSSATK